ncbi:hypothetical protein ES703_124490 [subsurface metagenome]
MVEVKEQKKRDKPGHNSDDCIVVKGLNGKKPKWVAVRPINLTFH